MSSLPSLLKMRNSTLALTQKGPPSRTSNQFFGIGPITDGVADEVEARLLRFELVSTSIQTGPLIGAYSMPKPPSCIREFDCLHPTQYFGAIKSFAGKVA